MSARTLLVIAKAPVPGRVKTRLTPPCSPEQAAAVAGAALADTLAAVEGAEASRRVVVLEGAMPVAPGFEVVRQSGHGLGQRLAAAFADCGGTGFLVAMDTPQLTAADLDHALAALERPDVDAAIGPTPDGGYWGIGFSRPAPGAFAGVPMSSRRHLRGPAAEAGRAPPGRGRAAAAA